MFTVTAIIASAFLYNAIRFFTPCKVYNYYLAISLRHRTTSAQVGKLWKSKKLPGPTNPDETIANERKHQAEHTDFMFAKQNILLFWITFLTPAMITYSTESIYKSRIQNEDILGLLHVIEWLTSIQGVLTVYLSFVPFYSDRFACWNKIGCLVHFIAVHVLFIVSPIIGIVYSLLYWKAVNESRS